MWPINRLKTFVRKMGMKQNPLMRSMIMSLSGSPIWSSEDIAKITREGYINCYAVFACVGRIVDAAAGIPWDLFKKPMSKGSKKEKIEDHGLLNLMKRPNPQDGGAAFIKNTLAFYLIAGNSYNITAGPVQGPPKEMYYTRPERIKILPGTKFEPIRGYRYTVNGVDHKPDFKPEEILHLKAFHPLDDWYGLSPIRVAAKQIDIQDMAARWNANLLKQDCRPPGALVTEGNLDDEQYTRLEKMIKEKIMGLENVGRPPIFEGGIKWEGFAISPKDMDWIESDKLNSRKICSVFNVAPELIGDAENKTYSNYKEARKALYMEAILPLMDFLRDEYNNWLVPQWNEDRLLLEYNKNAIAAIKEELDAVYKRQSLAWWRTVNERRIATGDDELGKAGDVILVPANLIPLLDISGNIKEE